MRTLELAVAQNATRKIWKNEVWSWEEFVKKIAKTHFTHETYKQYTQLSRPEQAQIKDVGGYVAGYLQGGRRNKDAVIRRSMLTLDLDFANINFWDTFGIFYSCEAVLHSSHKHSQETPRYRLIVPLGRDVSPEEYQAVARKFASQLDIELFDPTTFEVNRLMFWPSTSKDANYYFKHQRGQLLDPDEILSEYDDWENIEEWPFHSNVDKTLKAQLSKVEDPLTKPGIIGAFCRTYSIAEAIEYFIPDIYEATDDPSRYTYAGGSTAKGLVVYDDKLAYSFHGTDLAATGSCCNAFDLVRLHKFGMHDAKSKLEGTKLPSFKMMQSLALSLPEVSSLLIEDRRAEVKYEFADESKNDSEGELQLSDDDREAQLLKMLKTDKGGIVITDARNLNLIFEMDPHLAGKIKLNDFDKRRYVMDSMPWVEVPNPEVIADNWYGCLRNYLDHRFGIVGAGRVDDALARIFETNKFHPLKDYLDRLKWDGRNRIDELLIKCFGANDTIYSREAIRKALVASVARVYCPGIKFDNVLVLVGRQGTRKSSFFKKLGKEWFSDTFSTVQGKESFEQIQGKWIIEIGELAGLKKQEVETVKHYISKTADYFRPAYGRAVEECKRQCVFFGTTNNHLFLKDPTGNRRFWPVDVNFGNATLEIFSPEFENMIDQIWAEAVYLFNKQESLILSPEAEEIAEIERGNHSDQDDRTGLVIDFLESKVPENWNEMDIEQRKAWVDTPEMRVKGKYLRDYICVAEIWCELFGKPKEDMSRYNTRDINEILRALPGWIQRTSTKNFKNYGKQKYYERDLLL
jgi:predicted P-loop ATPase